MNVKDFEVVKTIGKGAYGRVQLVCTSDYYLLHLLA